VYNNKKRLAAAAEPEAMARTARRPGGKDCTTRVVILQMEFQRPPAVKARAGACYLLNLQ
jgi:hypothetical protein